VSDRAGLPASYDEDLSREPVYTTESPCPDCGCEPGNPWGCNCGNPYCPCSEDEDDE